MSLNCQSLGINGIVTFKNSGLSEIVRAIPISSLLLETDAPFLTPTPQRNRHRRNEPAFVRRVLEKVAQVKQVAPDSLAPRVWANTCRLFNLPAGLAD